MCPPRAGSACVSASFLLLSLRYSLPFSFSLSCLLARPSCSIRHRFGGLRFRGWIRCTTVRPRRDNQRYPMTKNPRRGRFDRMRNILFVLADHGLRVLLSGVLLSVLLDLSPWNCIGKRKRTNKRVIKKERVSLWQKRSSVFMKYFKKKIKCF